MKPPPRKKEAFNQTLRQTIVLFLEGNEGPRGLAFSVGVFVFTGVTLLGVISHVSSVWLGPCSRVSWPLTSESQPAHSPLDLLVKHPLLYLQGSSAHLPCFTSQPHSSQKRPHAFVNVSLLLAREGPWGMFIFYFVYLFAFW